MQLLMNVVRIFVAIVWTAVVGLPVCAVTWTTYWLGKLCALFGRADVLPRVIRWNAYFMSSAAQNWWSPVLLGVCGITTWTRESEPLDWSGSFVVCANHASVFDILVLMRVLPLPIRFVAKRELVKWPFIGWSLRPSGQIIVDRQRRELAIHSIEEASRYKIGGQVIFFVEGTRSRSGELLPFKRGAFHFAIDNQLPALPTAVVGSFGALARVPWWRLHPGRDIGVVFGAPVLPAPRAAGDELGAQVDELSAATRVQLESLLKSHDEASPR